MEFGDKKAFGTAALILAFESFADVVIEEVRDEAAEFIIKNAPYVEAFAEQQYKALVLGELFLISQEIIHKSNVVLARIFHEGR